MKWFIKCIKNYVNFKGRARRAEYWYFVLFTFLFMIAAAVLDTVLFGMKTRVISSLFGLFIFLPQVAVMVRRLHDTGRSGKIVMWYYIVGAVWAFALIATGISYFANVMQGALDANGMPTGAFLFVVIGGAVVFLVWAILLLVWFCTPGTVGDNKYGPDPKAVEE